MKILITGPAMTALTLIATNLCLATPTYLSEVSFKPCTTQAKSVQESLYWRNSTFNSANLDPAIPVNHAWWCGSWFSPYCPPEPIEGYGNNWDQWLMWENSVGEPSLPVTVRVMARLNLDCEPVYDILYLDAEKVSGWQNLAIWDGFHFGIHVDETVDLQPGDFTGEGDRVRLRFRFVSDGGWSDED